MTFEELKKDFKKNGFQIDGDSFVFEDTQYSTININGQIHKQPHTKRLELTYVGEGSICDTGDSDVEPLYQFDVLGDNKEPVVTICVQSFDDFASLV